MDTTSISFPSGAVGPGFTPPFLVASLRPGEGGVTGYGDINVAAMRLNGRVHGVRSPIGPVHGYRDQTRPLGPVTYIPTNLAGPIYPGVGKGGWHVGPTVVHGQLPYGPYSTRFWEQDRNLHTYGAPLRDIPEAYVTESRNQVGIGAFSGAVTGAVVGKLMFPELGIVKGALYGAAFAGAAMLVERLYLGVVLQTARK
jgi:hypothetical protein